jgi:hypothetical protein
MTAMAGNFDHASDQRSRRGAGDENRTRTISLGIRPIGASDRPELGSRCAASDRHGPYDTIANGPPMADGLGRSSYRAQGCAGIGWTVSVARLQAAVGTCRTAVRVAASPGWTDRESQLRGRCRSGDRCTALGTEAEIACRGAASLQILRVPCRYTLALACLRGDPSPRSRLGARRLELEAVARPAAEMITTRSACLVSSGRGLYAALPYHPARFRDGLRRVTAGSGRPNELSTCLTTSTCCSGDSNEPKLTAPGLGSPARATPAIRRLADRQ